MSDTTPPPGGSNDPGQPGYGQYGNPYGAGPYGNQPGPSYGAPDPHRRPATVTAAGVVTIILSGVTLALLLIGLVSLGAARDTVVDQMQTQPGLEGVDADQVVTVIGVVFVVLIIWCVVAIGLAVLAMRRSNGARIGLVVSAAVAGVLSLLGIASVVSAVTLAGAIAVIVCLFAGGASQWYAGRGGATPYPGPIA